MKVNEFTLPNMTIENMLSECGGPGDTVTVSYIEAHLFGATVTPRSTRYSALELRIRAFGEDVGVPWKE